MKRIGLLSIVMLTVVTLGCSRNEVGANKPYGSDTGAVGTTGEVDRNKVSSGDKDFVHDLAIANMAEVELGKLATERSSNAEVKSFGQRMIDDHTKAEDKLKTVASQHRIEVPNQLDDKHRDLRDKLAKLQGADFDREYIDAMVDGHGDVADKLESRIDKDTLAEWKSTTTDRLGGRKAEDKGEHRDHAGTVRPEKSDNPVTMSINQWAAETYPVAHAHLDAAKTLDNTIKRRTTH